MEIFTECQRIESMQPAYDMGWLFVFQFDNAPAWKVGFLAKTGQSFWVSWAETRMTEALAHVERLMSYEKSEMWAWIFRRAIAFKIAEIMDECFADGLNAKQAIDVVAAWADARMPKHAQDIALLGAEIYAQMQE